MVVKYSDNVHKGFLASIAIVLGILIDSVIFQDAEINSKFGLGSFMVLVSSFAYFQLTNSEYLLHSHHHHHAGSTLSGSSVNSGGTSTNSGHGSSNTHSGRDKLILDV